MTIVNQLDLSSGFEPLPCGTVLSSTIKDILKREGFFGLGESFIRGEFESDALDKLIFNLLERPELYPGKLSPITVYQLLREYLFNPQQGEGAFVVGERHYDLGNDLFRAMLDSSMSYTCAYWEGASTLEEAQKGKLELICKKLKLSPGMSVLDIGCGWGNFAHYAATHYGVSVTGLTVSKEQAALARERCEGLPVEILLTDYAAMDRQFDRVVSIEMIEAVGRKNLGVYFDTISRCLKEHGLCLIQAISTETFSLHSHPAVDQYVVWLLKHIFPNGYLPTFTQLAHPTRKSMVVEDIQNLSTNYAKTLHAWSENFVASWPQLRSNYDETFRRIWIYYLSGCMAFFRKRLVQVYQVVYSKNGFIGGYGNRT
jgi:cyclopropane-fatty-acyl-phospholipid synthase